jgi:hypothetical protein
VGVEVEKASTIVAVGRAVGVMEGTIALGGIGEYVTSTARLEPLTGDDVSCEYGKRFPHEASDTAVKCNKRKHNFLETWIANSIERPRSFIII